MEVSVSYSTLSFIIVIMGTISQLILADTGCVSYLIYCKKTNEVAIVDSFQGFEKDIEDAIKELKN